MTADAPSPVGPAAGDPWPDLVLCVRSGAEGRRLQFELHDRLGERRLARFEQPLQLPPKVPLPALFDHFGRSGHSLEGIGADEASWKAAPEMPSIWEILAHVSGHLGGLLADLNGTNGLDYDDWPIVDSGREGGWQATVEKFQEQVRQLERHVRGTNVEDLYSPIGGSRRRRSERMGEIFVHHAYHAGQIVILRKALA